MCEELKKTVEKAWDNRELLGDERVKQAIRDAMHTRQAVSGDDFTFTR